MAEIVNLGSLYLNGQPKDPGVEYSGEVFSFGNTDPERPIPFVRWGELLVASQCVCTNISWDELNKAGYIFGRPVKIKWGLHTSAALLRLAKWREHQMSGMPFWMIWRKVTTYGIGTIFISGARKMKKIWHRIVRFGGISRPAAGASSMLRIGTRVSVFAPPWNLCPLNLWSLNP